MASESQPSAAAAATDFMMLWQALTEYMNTIERAAVHKIDQIYALMRSAGTDVFRNDYMGFNNNDSMGAGGYEGGDGVTNVELIRQCIEEYFGSSVTDSHADDNRELDRLIRQHDFVNHSIQSRYSMVEQDIKNFIYTNASRLHSGILSPLLYSA
jgi:hypothetical protein